MLRQKNMAYNIHGGLLQIADSGKPTHTVSWLKVIQYSLLETGSLIFSGNRPPLLTDSENWHAATNSFEL